MITKSRILLLVFVTMVSTAAPSQSQEPSTLPAADTNRLIAIDVLLKPDSAMVEKAKAANVLLRENYPLGYALDATHAPHITLLQRYIRGEDLDGVTSAVGKVLAQERPQEWQLKATGYEYGVWDGKAITLLMVERSPDLMRLENAVAKAVEPFMAKGGSAEAFVTSPDSPEINKQTIDWVANFVPNASGENFKPHVTVGVAKEDFVKTLKAEKFDPFTFKVSHVAVYQLGNFGTARKKLWTSNSEH